MKRITALILALSLVFTLAACGGAEKESSGKKTDKTDAADTVDTAEETPEQSDKEMLWDLESWLVNDIWNAGFCDMSHYYYDGKSSTGQTMDPEFSIQQLEKAMEEKDDYDEKMAALPDEYADLKEIWLKVSEQIDVLYAEIEERGTDRSSGELDTGLFTQYFYAFLDEYNEVAY